MGLLFSSTLASVNVNSIYVNAAGIPGNVETSKEDPKKEQKQIKVKYIIDDSENELSSAEIEKAKLKATIDVNKDDKNVSLEKVQGLINDDYAFNETTSKDGFEIIDGNVITVKLIKKVDVKVYFDYSKNATTTNAETTKGKLVEVGTLHKQNYQEPINKDQLSVLPESKNYRIDDTTAQIDPKDKNEYRTTFKATRLINTTIKYVTPDGKSITQSVKTPEGEEIKLEAPKGFILPDNIKPGSHKASPDVKELSFLVTPAHQQVAPKPVQKVVTHINFLDKATQKPVYSQTVTGNPGQEIGIAAPTGYELDNKTNNKIKLNKAVSAVIVYVNETSTLDHSIDADMVVMTKKNVQLFDDNKKVIGNRGLGGHSDWRVDKTKSDNGTTYYRVARNEWVKAIDVVAYFNANSVITTKAGNYKFLYDVNGKRNGGRAIAANTPWYTDRVATINGEKMYRVATNEWVKAADVK